MKKALLLAVILFSVLCGGATADWARTSGGWLWLNTDGASDGWLYRQTYTRGTGWVTRRTSRVYAGRQQNNYQQSNYQQSNYNSSWRTKLLSLAAKQAEHKQYLEAISALGLSGGYGAQSPYGSQYGQSMNAYGVNISDLPLQQGNTIYGNQQPTFNSYSDPFRAFDLGVIMNRLAKMPEEMSAGSERVAGSVAATTRDIADTYRLTRETELRAQIIREVMPQLLSEVNKMMRANASLRIQAQKHGGQGAAAAAGAKANPEVEAFSKLVTVVSTSCMECHGGSKTGGGSEKLILGQGGTFKPESVSNEKWALILKRVKAGEMPPGGDLPEADRKLFELMVP